jgi:hypothetical protein
MALASPDIISVPPPIDSFEKDEAIPFDLLGDVVGVGGGGRLKQGGKYSKANKIPPNYLSSSMVVSKSSSKSSISCSTG